MMAETTVRVVEVATAATVAVLGLGKVVRSVLILALLVVLERCAKWMGARAVVTRRLHWHHWW